MSPGVAVTTKRLIDDPPVTRGATQLTLDPESLFETAATDVGLPGFVSGTIGSD
jgi:hypothetical protein